MGAAGTGYYLPGAEPYWFAGGRTGCLCVHGLASSPGETRWLAEALAEAGVTAVGIRLAGHGADYRALRHITWADWLGSVLDGYHLLRGQCDRVFIAGHSTGGTLALLAASQVAVDGVVLLAAPVVFDSRMMAVARWLRYVLPFTDQTDRSGLVEQVRDAQRRRGEPPRGRIRYDTWATNAAAQLYDLAQHTRPRLPQVTAPLLAIYARHDPTVTLANIEVITQAVASRHIEPHILDHDGHNLPIDPARDTVFPLVTDFVRRYSTESHHAAAQPGR